MDDKIKHRPMIVSIHAPPNRKERPHPCSHSPAAMRSFNPRPSQPEGAT